MKYPTYKPKFTGKSLAVKSITKSLDSIPWIEAHKAYSAAAAMARETANTSYIESYNAYIAELERKYYETHEAPYEGNFADMYPMPPTPLLEEKAREAGNKALVSNFIEVYGIADFGLSLMPQIITLLGNLSTEVHKAGPAEGKISGLAFRNTHFTTLDNRGLYRFLMMDTRSAYLTQQYKGAAREYCALVPLVMYAHRLIHQVPYSAWDRNEIQYIVNPDLAAAMLYAPEGLDESGQVANTIKFSTDELLEQQREGLTVRSGAKVGTLRNPTYTHKLSGPQLQQGILKDTPALARVMLTQIWCAHPDNRTKYMVLDPTNWDAVPSALINTSLFEPATIGSSSNFPLKSKSCSSLGSDLNNTAWD